MMMTTLGLSVVGIATVMVLLSAGVILGKRTPLKGSCGGLASGASKSCDECACRDRPRAG